MKTPKKPGYGSCKMCKRYRKMHRGVAHICARCIPEWEERNNFRRLNSEKKEELRSQLMLDHDGTCMACGAFPGRRRMGVDLEHKGLICFRCRNIIGLLRDNEHAIKIYKYLSRLDSE